MEKAKILNNKTLVRHFKRSYTQLLLDFTCQRGYTKSELVSTTCSLRLLSDIMSFKYKKSWALFIEGSIRLEHFTARSEAVHNFIEVFSTLKCVENSLKNIFPFLKSIFLKKSA